MQEDEALRDEKKSSQFGRRGFLKFLFGILVLGLLVVVATGFYGNHHINKPGPKHGDSEGGSIVWIKPGMSVNMISPMLEDLKVIENQDYFRVYTRLTDADGPIRAGEFFIPSRASLTEVAHILRFGDVIRHKLTFPEGITTKKTLGIVMTSDLLTGEIPLAAAKEGDLLPETYLVERGMKREALISQMSRAMRDVLEKEWEARQEGLPINGPLEALILASIVEKETGQNDERDRVAAVFINRLKKGMRLESDPTVIYGLTEGEPLGRGLRRSELDKHTEYNTYIIDRLPPGPICNPGRAAIHAVLNPAKTDDLFFVADGSGGHAFAKTYREHLKNVAKWRQIEKQRAAQ